MCATTAVLIPSSSGQGVTVFPAQNIFLLLYVLIPSSSGQGVTAGLIAELRGWVERLNPFFIRARCYSERHGRLQRQFGLNPFFIRARCYRFMDDRG